MPLSSWAWTPLTGSTTLPDLDYLLRELGVVNQQLTDDLNHLETIERYAQKASDVAALLAQAATALKDLRPTLL